MNEYDQAETVEGMITAEERQRAKTLEAILRYDLIREAKESKAETLQKIKDLINKKTVEIYIDSDDNLESDKDIHFLLDWMKDDNKTAFEF